MSTTRPLLGMRRVTELTCPERPTSRLPASAGRQSPEALTVDEFAVLEDKQEELKCAKPRVEQVFKVTFTIIGLLDHTGQPHGSKTARQIWLQLRGNREDVSRAKEYVRGLVDPELQKEERYPVDMHCIFASTRGLFLERLVWDTSAEVLVAGPGRLWLLGRAEPVVMAQSRVQQFVALFQEKRSLPSDRESTVKRAFKSFVEERDDKYTMELLLLPSALKEELLGLVHSPTCTTTPPPVSQLLHPSMAEVDQDRSQSSTPVTELSNRILDTSFDEKGVPPGSAAAAGGGKAGGGIGLGPEVVVHTRPSHKRRSSESETRDTKRHYSLERKEESPERTARERLRDREARGGGASSSSSSSSSSCRSKTPSASSTLASSAKSNTVSGAIAQESAEGGSEDGEAVSPETNLRCLVNFFRTMGYQQEVVERVVKATGQTEDTFLLLEKIVEETKRCEQGLKAGEREKHFNSVCTTDTSSTSSSSSSASSTVSRFREMELVRALEDPGRSKENIKPIHHAGSSNGLGHRRQCSGSERSTQQAITIRRSSSAQGGAGNYEVITIDDDEDVVPIHSKTADSRTSQMVTATHLDGTQSGSRTDYLARGGRGVPQRDYLSRCGAQTLGGPMKVENVTALRSSPQWLSATASLAATPSSAQPISRASTYQTISHAGFQGTPPTNDPPAPPVTGLARFHQSLKTPYNPNLPNEPGKPDLRHIIIDGSNVAMAHGLHQFFSCRGITLAVETFWRRGHREITVFVPQWRQKRDRLITEQHFLKLLEDLRLLSFTPSREVCGQRISSHDDRFMLHLAEKTDGIIVTNDNMRDLVDMSHTWRQIILERLLQFTFVEDCFMIPDDPLGKVGPHLDVFLSKTNRRSLSTPPPLRPPDFRASFQQPVNFQTPLAPPSLTSHRAAHWPHSGPPEWHPPRLSPSPSTPPPPTRTSGETSELKRKLYDIFPDHKQRIDRILSDNPYMRDLNALSGLLLG